MHAFVRTHRHIQYIPILRSEKTMEVAFGLVFPHSEFSYLTSMSCYVFLKNYVRLVIYFQLYHV